MVWPYFCRPWNMLERYNKSRCIWLQGLLVIVTSDCFGVFCLFVFFFALNRVLEFFFNFFFHRGITLCSNNENPVTHVRIMLQDLIEVVVSFSLSICYNTDNQSLLISASLNTKHPTWFHLEWDDRASGKVWVVIECVHLVPSHKATWIWGGTYELCWGPPCTWDVMGKSKLMRVAGRDPGAGVLQNSIHSHVIPCKGQNGQAGQWHHPWREHSDILGKGLSVALWCNWDSLLKQVPLTCSVLPKC